MGLVLSLFPAKVHISSQSGRRPRPVLWTTASHRVQCWSKAPAEILCRSYSSLQHQSVQMMTARDAACVYIIDCYSILSTVNERQQRIAALDEVVNKLKSLDVKDGPVVKVQRELGKVRDELTEYPEPDKSAIRKWLEYAKNAMGAAALGVEVTEAAKKLWELFEM
jgi:hypothetical protein